MDPVTLGMLAVLGFAFYFLLIRPQKQRQRAHAAMLAALGPGAQVITTSGIHGVIVDRTDSEIRLEIAPGTVITIVAAAIGSVVQGIPADDRGDQGE